jgi:hypothetical protein
VSLGNPTYTLMTLTKEEILDNHRSIYNGELVQVQSGGLDLKSSILRPCINFLYFVANGCGRGVWIDL